MLDPITAAADSCTDTRSIDRNSLAFDGDGCATPTSCTNVSLGAICRAKVVPRMTLSVKGGLRPPLTPARPPPAAATQTQHSPGLDRPLLHILPTHDMNHSQRFAGVAVGADRDRATGAGKGVGGS